MATNEESPTPPVARRPIRRRRAAAALASNRITHGVATQRRSTRLAVRNADAARTSGAPSPSNRLVSSVTPARVRGTKETPIVLDDEKIDEMGLKPAAIVREKVAIGATRSTAQKPPGDFTCAICLDAPSSMTEVASIDGCIHRFCFDCIDKWARTENKCPCCKARFRTIDRVVKLPSPPEVATPARKGKRKRATATANPSTTTRARRGGASSSPARTRRVNSRTIMEDRNQQSLSSFPINAAIVEQILASFSNFGGPRRGTGQVTFGTSEDGRPAIRMIRPASGGMVGVMEMLLPDDTAAGEEANGPSAGGSAMSRENEAVHGRGSSSSTRTAQVRFSTAPSGSSRSSLARVPSSGTAASDERGTSESAGIASGSGAASSAARPASASSRAARQGTSSFASFFASYGSSNMASPRNRMAAGGAASVDGSSANGDSSSSRSDRMTIRVIATERAADSERRTTGASGNGADANEPIIID